MSNAKHTPGPWWPVKNSCECWCIQTCRDRDTDCLNIGSKHGATICSGIGDHTEARTRGNEEANARLIAAAPELLDELEKAHRIIGNALQVMSFGQKHEWAKLNAQDGVDGEGTTRANEREAAIAKAEGK
jgi:hypothetical protein